MSRNFAQAYGRLRRPSDQLVAKEMAFCKSYGGDPVRVVTGAGMSEAEAARIVQEWGDRYPVLRDGLNNLRDEATTLVMDEGMRGRLEDVSPIWKERPPCNS